MQMSLYLRYFLNQKGGISLHSLLISQSVRTSVQSEIWRKGVLSSPSGSPQPHGENGLFRTWKYRAKYYSNGSKSPKSQSWYKIEE